MNCLYFELVGEQPYLTVSDVGVQAWLVLIPPIGRDTSGELVRSDLNRKVCQLYKELWASED